MGFRVSSVPLRTVYIFIGRALMIKACREIVDRHGMEAEFFEGDEYSLTGGHGALARKKITDNHTLEIVVYDTEAYSYSTILDLMAQSPDRHTLLGLYHRQPNMIITPYGIIE